MGLGEGLKVHRVAGVLLKCDPETKNPGPQKLTTEATWQSTNP